MKTKEKKLTITFIVLSLMVFSGNAFAQKRGVELVDLKINGHQVKGELIAVKGNSLILLSNSGVDVSVDIKEIRAIQMKKKTSALAGMILGGFIVGNVVAAATKNGTGAIIRFPTRGAKFSVVGLVAGSLIGGIVGGSMKTYETIQIEGRSDSEVRWILETLRSKARYPDYK
jgi:hypothetical protein